MADGLRSRSGQSPGLHPGSGGHASGVGGSKDRRGQLGAGRPCVARSDQPRIHSALVRDREIAELTHEASSPPVVAVDSRAPWHLAVQAMDGLAAAGVNRVGLAFRSSLVPPVPVPGPSPFDLLVEKARQSNDPAIKQAQLSEMASTLVSACAPLQNPLVTCARRGLARQTLVDAVLSCDCAADVASIKTVIWTLRRPNPGTLVPIDLGSAEGVAVVNQANMAWTFAHKRVLQAAKTMEPLGFSVRR